MITESMLALQLTTILKQNAPVRDGAKCPGRRGASPYPGNLKQNGIRGVQTADGVVVEVGYPDAPYAPYTETRSRKSGWQKKSHGELLQYLEGLGGKIELQ